MDLLVKSISAMAAGAISGVVFVLIFPSLAEDMVDFITEVFNNMFND